jgi:hypothetical protein
MMAITTATPIPMPTIVLAIKFQDKKKVKKL